MKGFQLTTRSESDERFAAVEGVSRALPLREEGNDLWVFEQREAEQVFLLTEALLEQEEVEGEQMKKLDSHKLPPAAHSIITHDG